MDRKLIRNSEDKISILQIIGFIVILSALIYLIIEQLLGKLDDKGGGIIAMDFFAIMLGVAFAFPDLLRDANNGLSTMRMVVFMMTNVICILLLKIGWGQTSLTAIGLNQYWMGVIAFVFGAKATQSYFENKPAAGGGAGGATTGGAAAGGAATGGAGAAAAGGAAGAATTGAGAGAAGGAAAADELDGCGIQPTQPTADAELPASKGGVA